MVSSWSSPLHAYFLSNPSSLQNNNMTSCKVSRNVWLCNLKCVCLCFLLEFLQNKRSDERLFNQFAINRKVSIFQFCIQSLFFNHLTPQLLGMGGWQWIILVFQKCWQFRLSLLIASFIILYLPLTVHSYYFHRTSSFSNGPDSWVSFKIHPCPSSRKHLFFNLNENTPEP